MDLDTYAVHLGPLRRVIKNSIGPKLAPLVCEMCGKNSLKSQISKTLTNQLTKKNQQSLYEITHAYYLTTNSSVHKILLVYK